MHFLGVKISPKTIIFFVLDADSSYIDFED